MNNKMVIAISAAYDSHVLGNRDDKPINYFVSYDEIGNVLNKRF